MILPYALSAAPVAARPATPDDERSAIVRSLVALDARVWGIGTRLAVAAAPLCPPGYAPGFAVQQASQYAAAYRPALAATLGIGERPTVAVVVPGSPADRAGLRPGDVLVAIDGRPLDGAAPASRPGFADVQRATDRIVAAIADGAVAIEVARGDGRATVRFAPDAACPARFDVRPGGGIDANANGTYVQVPSDLAQALPDDADLAALIAHEMAHNVLGHPAQLRALRGGLLAGAGAAGRARRATEIAADRLSVYILALAGYDPAGAVGFWGRLARRYDWGVLSDGTHPGWKARVTALQAEADRIAVLRARGEPVRPPGDLLPVSPS